MSLGEMLHLNLGKYSSFFHLLLETYAVSAHYRVSVLTLLVFFFSMFSQPALNSPQGLLVNS